jgi:hypothetical protein
MTAVGVVVLGDRRRLARAWRQLMALGREDVGWLAPFPRVDRRRPAEHHSQWRPPDEVGAA